MQPSTTKQIWDWNLTNHKPTEEGIEKIEQLRAAAKAYVDAVLQLTPASREQSLALTNLETASFYAIAAVARNHTEDVRESAEG